jgi:mannose-1-phosphate guanylyltransferase
MADASNGAVTRRVIETRVDRHACRRWAVILAGGAGSRLLPLTRQIAGDDRPKQFCSLVDNETLLQQTRRRVAKILTPSQTLIALTRTQEAFYVDQVADLPSSNLVIQPHNKGTAPAILYSLMRVREMDEAAIVAFFPSDHHIEDDGAFAVHMESAFVEAAIRPKSVVLLGIAPDSAEPEYGWIESGLMLARQAAGPIFRVRQFWEKPSREFAEELMVRGCLWNSFVMVGHVKAFLNLFGQALPSLTTAFESIRQSLFTDAKQWSLDGLYSRIDACNFSSEVLSTRSFYSAHPNDLAVLRASGLGWSDLGEPSRVYSVLTRRAIKTNPGALSGCLGAKTSGNPMNVITSKPSASSTSEVVVSNLYWLAYLLTECQEQSVSIVVNTLELVDDVDSISHPSVQLRLKEMVIENSISAIPNEGPQPLSTDFLPWSATARSCLLTQDRTFSWEEVKDAMLELEMFQRRVLLLTTFEGFSRSRVAALLGCDVDLISDAHPHAIWAFVSSFLSKKEVV